MYYTVYPLAQTNVILRDACPAFLSATAENDATIDPRVNEFLNYVAKGSISGELSTRLDEAVTRVLDDKKWRLEYMLLEVRDQINFDEGVEQGKRLGLQQGIEEGKQLGIEQGKQLGIEQGVEQGEARFAKLVTALLASGRSSEVASVAADPTLRDRLYDELGIK